MEHMRIRTFQSEDTEAVVALWAEAGLTRPWKNPRRGRGVGRALVEFVQAGLQVLGCPKVNVQVRGSNSQIVAFYEHLGYTVDETIDLGKRLIVDAPPQTGDR